MARLVPSTFPYESDTSAWAEKTFFEACRDQLDDDWLVLYSQRYVGRRSSLGRNHGLGEVDFILLHKSFGVIAVEVKGGQIDIDEGQWYSSNSKGRHKIKNPFVQAEEGARVIFETLKNEINAIRLTKSVNHCVAFPAVSQRSIGNISTYGPNEITIFREDLNNLSKSIQQVVTYWGQKPGWSDIEFKLIKGILLPTTKTPGMSYVEYVSILQELDRLTESQLRTLRQLTKDKGRSFVIGGAGTGKTVLAMSRAQQLALGGSKVLYLCANSSLAAHLESEIRTLGPPTVENLTVDTASGLISRLGRAGTHKEDFERRKELLSTREARFIDAISESSLEGSIECLIVDEAQDISKKDLDLVEFLVRKPEEGGCTIILGDPNQQLLLGRIESALGSIDESQARALDVNCRNTLEIAGVAHSFTDQAVETLETVSGIKVRKSRLRGELTDQVSNEIKLIRLEYDPSQIVVLTLNGLTDLDSNSALFVDGPRSELSANRFRGPQVDRVRVYSAREFQGREADAVVVALTEKSLLRTFPFRRFAVEAKKNSKIISRQQSLIDLHRVEEMFRRFRKSGIPKAVDNFESELTASHPDISENRKSFLIREFERTREMEFVPRFNDPFLQVLWKERQKQSLKVSLYSMMTRARVILSVVGDKPSLKFIETELNSDEGVVEVSVI